MSDIAARLPQPPDLPRTLSRLVHSPWFVGVIIVAIALAGLSSGLETYPAFRAGAVGTAVDWMQGTILVIFVAEILLRIGTYGDRPWRFFTVGWNVFDFAIVVLCLLPLDAQYVVVIRLLRMLRLFTALHGLQILVSGLLKGIPSLGYVGLLLLLHFYIYAVIGTFAFGDNDPVRFGSLHRSMLTLFQVLTLEGWNDILATQFHGSDVGYDDAWKQLAGDRVSVARPLTAALYFVSFILIGTIIVLNLFTGVIIRSIEEAHVEAAAEAQQRRAKAARLSPQDELEQIGTDLQALATRAAGLQERLATADQRGDEQRGEGPSSMP